MASARTSTRQELVAQVKRVKALARARGQKQAALLPGSSDARPSAPSALGDLAAEVPVRLGFDFTPEQFARWEGLWAILRKARIAGDRSEILLDALGALAAERVQRQENPATSGDSSGSADFTPRG